MRVPENDLHTSLHNASPNQTILFLHIEMNTNKFYLNKAELLLTRSLAARKVELR
jgi:hypothetical protein